MGGVTAGSAPCLVVNRANSVPIYNSKITVDLQANTTRPILSTSDFNESATSNYYINNTTFHAFTSSGIGTANIYLPLNVAQNASTSNVEMFGGALAVGQPAFTANYVSDATNATGDGTTYSLNAYTSNALINNGYFGTSTSIFTAPQNGAYRFNALLRLANIGAGHTSAVLSLVTTAKTYTLCQINPYAISPGGGASFLSGCVIAKLNAGDTAYLTIQVSGSTKTVTIANGATNFNSNFGCEKVINI